MLLVIVAFRLGMDNRELLIGRSADARDLAAIRDVIEHSDGVDELLELLTMHLGPDNLIVAARVALNDGLSADDAEDLADRIEQRLGERVSEVSHVFIDPTPREAERRERAGHRQRAADRDRADDEQHAHEQQTQSSQAR